MSSLPGVRRFTMLCAATVFCAAWTAEAGSALRLYYDGIKGLRVRELMADPRFPGSPTKAEGEVNGLSRLERGGDNWGSWMRGYLEAPQTGNYIFSIASDDQAELWLSPTHESFQVRKVFENTNSIVRLQFKTKSEPVSLVRGQKYYFELYHKEGTGADHVSVAWQLPDGSIENPVPSHRFMPVPVNAKYQTVEKAPAFLSEYFGQMTSALTNVTAVEGETLLLAGTVEGSQPLTFQWLKNGVPIPGANLSSLSLTNVQLVETGERYGLVVSNALGSVKREAVLTVNPDDLPPQIVSAFSVTTPNTLAVMFSEALDPSTVVATNFELNNGGQVTGVKLVSPTTVSLNTASLQEGKTYKVHVRNVRDAARRNTIAPNSHFTVDEGLLAWLRFDSKDSSDLVPDASGNYNAAVLMNGARLNAQGVAGSCLELDGRDDHAVLPSGFKSFTKGMAVCFWAKPAATTHFARFLDLGNGPSSGNIVVARMAKTSNLVLESHSKDKRLARAMATGALENGVWQHFAISMDARGEVAFYKDGELFAQGTAMVPLDVERTRNLIGKSNWDSDHTYKGWIDDMRIYERPLRAAEVQLISQRGN